MTTRPQPSKRSSPAALRPATRIRILLGIVLFALLAGSCAALAPPARLAERTALLLPSFFIQLPVNPTGFGSAVIVHSDIAVGSAYPGAVIHVYRPSTGRYPALIISLGLEPGPPDSPEVVRLLQGLAETGTIAALVQSPALDAGDLQADAPQLLVSAFRIVASQAYVEPGRVGLFGFSVGGSLALIAAADPQISNQVRLVEAFGAYGRLSSLTRATVTHTLVLDGKTEPWQPDDHTTLLARQNVIDQLPAAADRAALESAFQTMPAREPAALSPDADDVFQLLTAPDGNSFDGDYAALPADLRANLDSLSPQVYLQQIRAPVWLMVDEGDPLIPYPESLGIAQSLKQAGAPAYFSEFNIFRHVEPTRGGSPMIVTRDVLRLYLQTAAVLGRL